MQRNFSMFLLEQNWMKVVRVLHTLRAPLCLRELVDLTGLSPAGVQDVLRRLSEQKVISSRPKANRILYTLSLNEHEKEFLEQIIKEQNKSEIKNRAKVFSKRRVNAISWIDEAVKTWRHGKGNTTLPKTTTA